MIIYYTHLLTFCRILSPMTLYNSMWIEFIINTLSFNPKQGHRNVKMPAFCKHLWPWCWMISRLKAMIRNKYNQILHPTIKNKREWSTHTNSQTFTKDMHSKPNEWLFLQQVVIQLSFSYPNWIQSEMPIFIQTMNYNLSDQACYK